MKKNRRKFFFLIKKIGWEPKSGWVGHCMNSSTKKCPIIINNEQDKDDVLIEIGEREKKDVYVSYLLLLIVKKKEKRVKA